MYPTKKELEVGLAAVFNKIGVSIPIGIEYYRANESRSLLMFEIPDQTHSFPSDGALPPSFVTLVTGEKYGCTQALYAHEVAGGWVIFETTDVLEPDVDGCSACMEMDAYWAKDIKSEDVAKLARRFAFEWGDGSISSSFRNLLEGEIVSGASQLVAFLKNSGRLKQMAETAVGNMGDIFYDAEEYCEDGSEAVMPSDTAAECVEDAIAEAIESLIDRDFVSPNKISADWVSVLSVDLMAA